MKHSKSLIALACSIQYVINYEPPPEYTYIKTKQSWTSLNRGKLSKAQRRNK